MSVTALTHLAECLASQKATFLQPTSQLHEATLALATRYLDSLASDLVDARDARQEEQRLNRSRKRGAPSLPDDASPLKIRRIYTQGFPVEQVWQQSRRVIDAALEEVETHIERFSAFEDASVQLNARNDSELEESDEGEDLGEEGIDYEVEGEDDELDSAVDEDIEDEDLFDQDETAHDDGSDPIDEDTLESDASEDEDDGSGEFVKDKHGLNDGFFSIDDFNKRTQFLEQQDERGDPNDGAASDEEDVDWNSNPLASAVQSLGSSRPFRDQREEYEDSADDDDDDDDDGGPTFGNVDLNAPEGESDVDMDDGDEEDLDGAGMGGDFSNTNDIMYADFFAPPAKQAKGSRAQKPRNKKKKSSKTQTGALLKEDDAEDEIQRVMSKVHRDLFEDDPSDAEVEHEEDQPEPGTRNANLSSHERRQLALQAEIRKLEAENVANKHWSMTGETVAPARPMNSLLEEDLEFERAGKPVPIITSEISESIEQLIKRRILNKEFDEVIRRRPTDLATGPDPRRGQLKEDISDAKPTRGLAEEYEDDYLRKNDPNYVDTRSEALKAQHSQIEEQWRQISALLDSLSNWHYKPRPSAANLEVRVDAPTIALEDAQPTAAGGMNGESTLAPQEIYRPGEEGKRQGEMLTKGGTAVGREEMSREDSKRQRRRAKERRRKLEGNKPIVSGEQNTRKGKEKAVADQLRKGGVKVLDKKSGASLVSTEKRSGAGNLKL